MNTNMSRRSFVAGSAAVSAGIAATAVTGAFADEAAVSYPEYTGEAEFEASAAELEPITDFIDEQTFDIVVVGAGTAGLPAVLTALEEGVTVGCLQKEATPLSQGNGSSGIIVSESTDSGIKRWMQSIRKTCNFRVNWDLFEFFAYHSGETLCWLDKVADEAGYVGVSHSTAISVTYDNGDICAWVSHAFGTKPESNNNLVAALAPLAEQKGAKFFYETPGVQLIQDETGRVVGVIGKSEAGYIKFNANIAVILATGDYQNNKPLMARFSPAIKDFAPKQYGKTGDGHLMAMMAGGRMVPVGHAHQVHDADAAGNGFSNIPLLALNANGKRFMNEEVSMPFWNLGCQRNTDQEDPGVFVRIFDANYQEYFPNAPAPEKLQVYIPGAVEDPKGVFPTLIDTHCCDTLDELAEALRVPADALKESVARYNEIVASGVDSDYGVDPANLHPIDTPPFWGIRQWVRISAINGGIKVDKNYQVVDSNNEPIPGLFAVGTTGGDLCGNADWSMGSGVSCGHCFTSGRYATIFAITGGYEPAAPVAWEEVSDLYVDGMHDTGWAWQRK
ncbi:MAG: FAD-binding protein [Coriobacteriales bacterium]|nr:FAD-binding protein [Coriobacteriales bacterium]